MKRTLTLLITAFLILSGTAKAQHAEGQRVIYEMNVGSFTQAGTFRAAQDRLADLQDLGIDIVWLMPVYPRGGGVNSPYAATDFQAVNPSYGSISDLRSFVTEAHRLGMQVWLDWVPNHTATNATWVTTHPEYYTSSGGQMVHPNNYGDVYQLNYSNSGLVEAMNDCLKFWIDQADIDGYRCDYISSNGIPASYWTSTIPMIKNYKSGKSITFLGEGDLTDGNLSRLRDVGFDYDYAWGYQESSLQNGFGATGTSANVIKTYTSTFISNSQSLGTGRMVYLTNHDKNYNEGGHTLSQMYGANRYALTVLQFTIYGMPLLYNGQEIGGNQILNYFSDTKIDWTNPDKKMENTVRSLTSLKHTAAALHDGPAATDNASVTWLTVTNSQNVLAYKRTNGDSEVLVVLNFGSAAVDATILGASAGEYSLWLDSKTIERGVSRKSINLNTTNNFSLDAKGYAVYVKGHFDEIALEEEEPIGSLTDDSEYSVYYETPTDATICVWLWNDNNPQYTANSWPGDAMTRVGVTAEGHVVYRYTINVPVGDSGPTNLIFTKNGAGDENKTFDGIFVNHGYYVEGQGVAVRTIPTTSIELLASDSSTAPAAIYNLQGQRMPQAAPSLPRGIYISNGRKFVVH